MNRDQAAWQAQSLLIGYPDDLAGRLAMLRCVAASLDRAVAAPMIRFLDLAERTPEAELAADYVATFDHRKRCCLFLTYYAYGDTRKRGIALLAIKRKYAAAGLALSDEELPDHLAVMLEYAATARRIAARRCSQRTGPVSSCCGWRCADATRRGLMCSTRSRPRCRRCGATSEPRQRGLRPKDRLRGKSGLRRSRRPSTCPIRKG